MEEVKSVVISPQTAIEGGHHLNQRETKHALGSRLITRRARKPRLAILSTALCRLQFKPEAKLETLPVVH